MIPEGSWTWSGVDRSVCVCVRVYWSMVLFEVLSEEPGDILRQFGCVSVDRYDCCGSSTRISHLQQGEFRLAWMAPWRTNTLTQQITWTRHLLLTEPWWFTIQYSLHRDSRDLNTYEWCLSKWNCPLTVSAEVFWIVFNMLLCGFWMFATSLPSQNLHVWRLFNSFIAQ